MSTFLIVVISLMILSWVFILFEAWRAPYMDEDTGKITKPGRNISKLLQKSGIFRSKRK